MSHGIIIPLTEEQQRMIEQLLIYSDKEQEQGRIGLILAQVYEDHMDVGYIPQETALKIVALTGNVTGRTIEQAIDKEQHVVRGGTA